MSKAQLNTIFLGIIFFIVAGLSYYGLKNYAMVDLENLKVTRSEKQEYDAEFKRLADQRETLSDSLDVLLLAYRNQTKLLPPQENTKMSFDYFNKLALGSNSSVNLTFTAGGKNDFENFFTTDYTLEGEATFYNFYNFLWKLEHYKRLYVLQSLSLQETKLNEAGKAPRSYIRFTMAVKGYSSKNTFSLEKEITENVKHISLSHNPFFPLIRNFIPPNSANRLDVDKAVLEGLTEDRAFIAGSNGNLKVMSVGDRVYLGRLTRIDQARGFVEFTLNKGGIFERKRLRVQK